MKEKYFYYIMEQSYWKGLTKYEKNLLIYLISAYYLKIWM